MAEQKQDQEYAYDDYMPEETLYDKYAKIVNYPYENSDFVRGASDKMNYETRDLLNPNDPYFVPRVVGTASAPMLGYGLYKATEGLDDSSRGLIGTGAAVASRFAPDPTSEKIYAKRTPEPQEDNIMYKMGKQAVPLSMAYGVGKAFQNGDMTSALPYFAAPTLAGMVHPSYNPFIRTAEYLDKDK